jgi:threonine dehydratase
MADGMACRVPVPEAVEAILRGAARVVTVSDHEIRSAMRALFSDTHNVAEGAGAASLAAALKESVRNAGKRIGLVLSGGNVDRRLFASILEEED